MYKSLKYELIKILQSERRPDLLILSGDLVDRGIQENFRPFKNWLDEILTKANYSKDKCIISFGNHDIVQSLVDSDESNCKDNYFTLQDSFKSNLPLYNNKFSQHIAEFGDYCSTSSFNFLNDVNLIGYKVVGKYRFINLNSSWFCQHNPERIHEYFNTVVDLNKIIDEDTCMAELVVLEDYLLKKVNISSDFKINIKKIIAREEQKGNYIKNGEFIKLFEKVSKNIIKKIFQLWETNKLSFSDFILNSIISEFESSSSDYYNILVMHHPPNFINKIELNKLNINKRSGSFRSFCESMRIRYICCGHIHLSYSSIESIYYEVNCLVGGYFGTDYLDENSVSTPNFFNIYTFVDNQLSESVQYQYDGSSFNEITYPL